MIGCTQPRRVAAMSVAKRVSDEMGTQLGRCSVLINNVFCIVSAILNRLDVYVHIYLLHF